jgi:cobaltochelatase CobS
MADKVSLDAKLEDDGTVKIYNSTLEKLGEEVKTHALTKMKGGIVQAVANATQLESDRAEKLAREKFENLSNDIRALAESVRPIEIKTPTSTRKLKGVQHNQFQNLLTIVNAGEPVLMVGPAGTGKTHGAALVAEALGLSFHSISVGSQTSKSDLSGYMDATHTYVRTQFREAYENGGIFLLDEADAGNSNVLILLNAALSNGYMAFPDGMVQAHKDFRMIATANTFGNGASRQYVGRNQLDAATLDRFVVLTWDIDDRVEEAMAGDQTKWLAVVRAVRKKVVTELELRVVISPRATLRGAKLLEAGMSFEQVLPIALTANLGSERKSLELIATALWEK